MIHFKSSYVIDFTKDRTIHKDKTQKLNNNDKEKRKNSCLNGSQW